MLKNGLFFTSLLALFSAIVYSKDISDLGELKQQYDFKEISVSKTQPNDGGGFLYTQKSAALIDLKGHMASILIENRIDRDPSFSDRAITHNMGHNLFNCQKNTLVYGDHDVYGDHGEFMFKIEGMDITVNRADFIADATSSLEHLHDQSQEARIAGEAFDKIQKMACGRLGD